MRASMRARIKKRVEEIIEMMQTEGQNSRMARSSPCCQIADAPNLHLSGGKVSSNLKAGDLKTIGEN